MSEQYLVSARKYRPQTFKTVIGQEHITTTLKNAIRQNQLAHAYLFCGPRGVGKTTCARILAKTINCENPTPEMEACGTCPTCLSFSNNSSFNVFELDAASNNSVDDIRELVSQVRFAPQQGRYKIYIIDEVHMLSAAAFNAFLKTLEEPPPYAIFILATTEKHKILPTILSRCQIFDFKRITTQDIVDHLQYICTEEGRTADESALHVIAQKSEGCMRDALSMMDRIASFTNGQLTYASTMEHLNILDAAFYFRLSDCFLSSDVGEALLALDEVLERGFEGDVIISGLAEYYRNLLLCKDPRMVKLLDLPANHKPMYFEKARQTPPSFILSAINVLNDSELHYRQASNKRLHTELCLIRLCYLQQAIDPQDVPVKKNTDFVAPAAQPAPIETSHTDELPEIVITPIPAAKQELPAVPVPEEPKPKTSSIPPAFDKEIPLPPEPGQSSSRRVRKNMLDELEATLKQDADEGRRDLSQEYIDEIFLEFRELLKTRNQAIIVAQFAMMQVEFHEPDEIQFIAPTEMAFACVQQHRNELIETFRQKTGHPVRVLPKLFEQPGVEPQTTTLSRQELYDKMAAENPNLARLKEGMNLHLDF